MHIVIYACTTLFSCVNFYIFCFFFSVLFLFLFFFPLDVNVFYYVCSVQRFEPLVRSYKCPVLLSLFSKVHLKYYY